MSDFLKQAFTKTIARQFFLWFLVLCFTILAALLIVHHESHWYSFLIDKSVASMCLTPLGVALKIIVKGDKPVKEQELKYQDKENKRQYKLERLRIKKGLK